MLVPSMSIGTNFASEARKAALPQAVNSSSAHWENSRPFGPSWSAIVIWQIRWAVSGVSP